MGAAFLPVGDGGDGLGELEQLASPRRQRCWGARNPSRGDHGDDPVYAVPTGVH